ncbi:MAG TPA: hypothetical protein VKP30_18865, partial [Polyangiaceae bacterium]|nr:hypothetical protein [Polyangiaceae bacterium]
MSLNSACQGVSPEPHRQSARRASSYAVVASAKPEPAKEQAMDAGSSESPRARFAPSPETLDQIAKIRGSKWQLFAQSYPTSRLAFFARSLAFVSNNAIQAVPVLAEHGNNPCRSNQLSVDAPREIVTLADQTLLVLGKSTSFVLDSNCKTTRVLPRVSYLPGYHLLPDPRWANAFSLFDPPSGRFLQFRWEASDTAPRSVFLPTAEVEDF